MDADNAFLHRQLIRLGDMMGDGMHHEPDGKWISKEYKRILKALGMLPKVKKNVSGINKAMSEVLKMSRCLDCDGKLKQSRSGSRRAICVECGVRFQFKKRKRQKSA